MCRRGRLLLTLLVGAGALALGVAAASAANFSVTNQTISVTWSSFRFNEGRAQCPVTLEGSVHARTLQKVQSLLVGNIIAGRTGRCSVGSAVLLTAEDGQRSSLPWHIQYGGFSGTLPAITRVRWHIFGLSYRIVKELETCLYSTSPTRPALLDLVREEGSGALRSASFFGTEAIPLATGNPLICEASGLLGGGAGPVTIWGSATRVTLSLI